MNNMWVLAQSNQNTDQIESEPLSGQAMTSVDGSPPNQSADQEGQNPKGPGPMFFIVVAVTFVFLYMTMFRGPKKKQQEHKQMLQDLKKNDRVRTVGGIYGTVMDVKGDEVVVKIDETTNTKIRVSNSAISMNLSKENQ